ncbi:MAG TPA: hypothetical protein VFW14_14350 [Gaiellales bacterium]|nr:hypothetical protein [Gaiellales bacterium]
MQLRSLNAGAIIPVSDMDASRAFYEGTLELDGEPAPGGYALRAGGTTRLFLLDVAAYAGQADWPLASFQTDDLAATVADLGDMLIAWFRDPDDQVISVFQLT